MSTATQPAVAAPQLPDPKVAYDTLFQNVHAQAFFGRLAQYGVVPANEKQAESLLELGAKLAVIENDPRVKQSNDQADPITQASAALDRVMGHYGLGVDKQAAAAEQACLTAANALASDPVIYNSVLSLKAAEAQQAAAGARA